MKKFSIILLSTFFCICACNNKSAEDSAQVVSQKLLRHVLFFNFNDDLSAEHIKEIEDAFVALPSQIKEIKSFEWGTEINQKKDFSHCFVLSFESEEALQAYIEHPAHKDLADMTSEKTQAISVMDYWER